MNETGTDGKITLKWILKKCSLMMWTGFITISSCEHVIAPSYSTNGAEFLDQVSDYQLLKENSTPWS
jgi:hypothetical protein